MVESVKVEEMPVHIDEYNSFIESKNPIQRLMDKAIESGSPVEVLEKLMALQERLETRQAEKAFADSMALFQSECPIIIKSVKGAVTKAGDEAYKFAPMDIILSTVNDKNESVRQLIAKHGFNYTFDIPEIDADSINVRIKITHRLGHTQYSSVKFPFVEKTGVMSPPQVIASTRTYALRYAFMDGFGIMTGDEDNDANLTETWIELTNQLHAKIQNYRETQRQNILKMAETIKTKKIVLKELIQNLPSEKYTEEFSKLISDVPEKQKDNIWNAWITQTPDKIENFLTKLKEKLNGK
jgi:hypothetical protein